MIDDYGHRYVAVPNWLDEAVERMIEDAVRKTPQWESEREQMRRDLFAVYDERGTLDGVEIKAKGEA